MPATNVPWPRPSPGELFGSVAQVDRRDEPAAEVGAALDARVDDRDRRHVRPWTTGSLSRLQFVAGSDRVRPEPASTTTCGVPTHVRVDTTGTSGVIETKIAPVGGEAGDLGAGQPRRDAGDRVELGR